MEYIKSPFNWVGNKYKHLDVVNDIIEERDYYNVIDVFMGTGNLLLNVNANGKYYDWKIDGKFQ